MDVERLKQLIKKYRESMSYYHDIKNAYNETECRDEYISPLLECFGWDVHNKKGKAPQYKEVVVEKFSNSSERPDYTLTLNGVSKMFVEAKKPSVDVTIETEPAMQTRKYGWNANHALAILTNFENFLVYDTTNKPEEGDSVSTSLYKKYYYEDYVDKFQEIADLISRDNVYSGKYDEFVKSNLQSDARYSTEIDETFLKQINKWRLEIGTYLYENKAGYKNISVLNDTVQDFINQIIFLRICEDRKLPLYMNLYEAVKDKKALQKVLTTIFKEADKRYNSGLFKNDNPIFDLSCDIIFEMIESLYYPKTPYMFTIIEPSILGKIYESFLAESLVLQNGKISLAQKKEYLYKSVVSTPVVIVRYMVKNTLEPLCEAKTPQEILSLRIADIACGSGVFLEEAYQYLVDYCTEWYKINDNGHLLEVEDGKEKLPLVDKKAILTNCIYGVDIDIHAVEVSKFSLLLKLIENETEPSVMSSKPILPELEDNIKCGNSLVSDNDIEEFNITSEDLVNIAPFDWKEINDGNKFDVIIGNPPYVKTEDIKKLHTNTEVKVFKKYKSSHKQFDKYYLFIEKALELVNAKGLICYIVPNKFLHTESAEMLRLMIKDKIVKLDDFGATQLFKDKTIYSSILTLCTTNVDKLAYRTVEKVANLLNDEAEQYRFIPKPCLNCMPWVEKEKFNDSSPWLVSDDDVYLNMMKNASPRIVPLSDVVEIYNGIQTSAEKVYKIEGKTIVSEDEDYVKFKAHDKEYMIEREILRLYFKPTRAEQGGLDTYSDINQVKVNYNIFPYNQNGSFITKDIMETRYPYAWEYLLEHKDTLLPKSLGGNRDVKPTVFDKDEWYRYGRSQAITSLNNRDKIIVGVNRKKDDPLYLMDKTHYLIASGGTAGYVGISLKEDSEYQLEYIHAWLSHPLTDWYLQSIGSDFEGGFVARGTYTLPMVPFIKLDFADKKQMELYDQVIANTVRISEFNKELLSKKDKATQNVVEKEKNKLIKQNERMITRVYQQDF